MREVKVGVVGLGRLGRQHAENLAHRIPFCRLHAVCSVIQTEIDHFQEKFEGVKGYLEYEEMIKDKNLDAVFIASPSGFHGNQITSALKRGLHVFCEKPLSLSMKEAEEIEEVVNKYPEQVFMLGFMRRYDSSYQAAKEKIEAGAIGDPYLVRCYGLDPAAEKDNFLAVARANYTGGIFLDMSVHDFDLARWFLNREALETWAIGGSYTRQEFTDLNDAEVGAAMMRFEDNKMGIFLASRNSAHGYHVETEIIGTEGSLRIGTVPEKNQVVIMGEEGVLHECVSGFLERFEQAYLKEAEVFISSILTGKAPGVSVGDGVEATRMGYACKESFEKGGLIKVKELEASSLTEGTSL